MGGYIKVDADRVEITALNQKINKEVFDDFKYVCKEQGYPMNVVLETFMRQHANGRFKLKAEDILKFKNDGKPVDTLNTTFNKEIYLKFKSSCKLRGFFVKHVITAFMEKYAEENLILEFVDKDTIKKFKVNKKETAEEPINEEVSEINKEYIDEMIEEAKEAIIEEPIDGEVSEINREYIEEIVTETKE